MEKQSVIHSTFVIERHYPVTPERVFAALSDPARKRRWFAESEGHDVKEFEMSFRVGGSEHARFQFEENHPLKGAVLTHDGGYLDIVPDQRVVIASTMAIGGKRFSASLATFELVAANHGTDLIFTHQGAFFEGADGPQMREGGWQKLLEKLAKELTR
jgi:uncharacterized protein YndB with AHSA1/START domain